MSIESEKIASIIDLLDRGPYEVSKPYLDTLRMEDIVKIDNFYFACGNPMDGYGGMSSNWCISKLRDETNESPRRNEYVTKFIPRNIYNKDAIEKILDAEPWLYL